MVVKPTGSCAWKISVPSSVLLELREHVCTKTKELSSILLLVEDVSIKLQQIQQVNYLASKKNYRYHIPRETKNMQFYITKVAILDLS